MDNNKWIKRAAAWFVLFGVSIPIALAGVFYIYMALYLWDDRGRIVTVWTYVIGIAPAIGTLVTALGTISTLILAWRLDRRQTRESILKDQEARLRIAELEAKISALEKKPNENG